MMFRIPAPTVPPKAAIMDVFGDAFAIAIVCFVVNISMAKLFATKYKYQISPNQVFCVLHLFVIDVKMKFSFIFS